VPRAETGQHRSGPGHLGEEQSGLSCGRHPLKSLTLPLGAICPPTQHTCCGVTWRSGPLATRAVRFCATATPLPYHDRRSRISIPRSSGPLASTGPTSGRRGARQRLGSSHFRALTRKAGVRCSFLGLSQSGAGEPASTEPPPIGAPVGSIHTLLQLALIRILRNVPRATRMPCSQARQTLGRRQEA